MSQPTRFVPPLPARHLALVPFVLLLATACRHAGAGAAITPEPADRVNVGYSTLDRRDVTGAVSSIGERELQTMRVTRVEELLRDRVPGLLVTPGPGGGFSIRIRGARSLLAEHEPLVVVDGVPMGAGVLGDLVPGNIVRIDVLKDAGSTAAYGSRGANGVIIVATTRAR